MSRKYPSRPMVGVGAIIIDEERVLLVHRAREPSKGLWSIPGGMLEVGESLSEGVRREVREEVGLEVEVLGLVEVLERIIRDPAGKVEYHYVLVDYLCKPLAGSLRPSDDVDGAEWASRHKLDDYHMTEGTPAVIEKAFLAREKNLPRS